MVSSWKIRDRFHEGLNISAQASTPSAKSLRRSPWLALLMALGMSTACPAEDMPALTTGLPGASAVAVTRDGKVYVAAGDANGGKGAIHAIEKDKISAFATGLKDPRSLVSHGQWLFAAERQHILKIGRDGKTEVLVDAGAFPSEPQSLGALAVDLQGGPKGGTLFVCDAGDHQGKGAAVYRITPGKVVSLLVDGKNLPSLRTPSGLALDGAAFLLL